MGGRDDKARPGPGIAPGRGVFGAAGPSGGMFGTSGVRGRVGETVTPALAVSVGRAVAADADRVVVGHDPRTTGPALVDALSAGLVGGGADVVDLGLAATPTVARSVGRCEADAGVSVTASHNPPEDNGLKLLGPDGGGFDAERQAAVAELVEGPPAWADWRAYGVREPWGRARERHVAAVLDAVGAADLEVVVDVGTGAGGLTVDVLEGMGCSVAAVNAQPDGAFPGRPSEPTAEHCGVLRRFVEARGADLGVALDGDADRLLAVTASGRWVGGDVLLALFATAEAGAGDRVAAPLNTSLAVDDALEAVGAELVRTRVGDVAVAERTREPDVVFGGEPSGAWIWPDETRCPDGTLAAAKLAELVAGRGPLDALVGAIETHPIRRTAIETSEAAAAMAAVAEAVDGRYDDVGTLDGVRVDLGDAWFLIRPSGTQPLIRVTAEARSADRAEAVFAAARELVEEAIGTATGRV